MRMATCHLIVPPPRRGEGESQNTSGSYGVPAPIPRTGEDGTFHTNPKRKRGRVLPPRLRFGLVSACTA